MVWRSTIRESSWMSKEVWQSRNGNRGGLAEDLERRGKAEKTSVRSCPKESVWMESFQNRIGTAGIAIEGAENKAVAVEAVIMEGEIDLLIGKAEENQKATARKTTGDEEKEVAHVNAIDTMTNRATGKDREGRGQGVGIESKRKRARARVMAACLLLSL